MTVCHEASFKTETLLGNIQLAGSGDCVALPYARCSIAVWNLQDESNEPLLLEGHRRSVTALAFSQSQNPTMLFSAAAGDYIIRWNVDQLLANRGGRGRTRGQVLCLVPSSASHATYVCSSPDNRLVAVSADKLIYVVDVKGSKVTAILEGHSGNVNCAEFCPHYTATMVSVSDDRTFRVWGLSSSTLLYQSTIVSSSPFLKLAMHPTHQSFAVGSDDGMVRIYDLADGHDFRCLHQVDVGKLLKRNQVPSVTQSYRERDDSPVRIGGVHSVQPQPSADAACDESEASVSITGLAYCTCSGSHSTHLASASSLPSLLSHENDTVVSELLSSTPILYVATTGAILRLNASSLELLDCFSLQGSVPSASSSVLHGRKDLTLSSNAFFTQSSTLPQKVWCVLGKHFRREVDVLSLTSDEDIPHQRQSSNADACSGTSDLSADGVWWTSEFHNDLRDVVSVLSRLARSGSAEGTVAGCSKSSSTYDQSLRRRRPQSSSRAPLVANSPLKAELQPKTHQPTKPPKKSAVAVQKAGTLNKKGEIVDQQPITFHKNIKSSGYSQVQQRHTMFQPKTNHSTKVKKSSSVPRLSSGSTTSSRSEYPVTGDPPVNLVSVLNVAERPAAINSLRFSVKGDNLVCGLNNSTAVVFSSSTKDRLSCSSALAGHDQSVSCASWSHSGRLVITSSDDRTTNVWSLGTLDPILTISTTGNNIAANDKSNVAFSGPVRCSQFYYMDRFILLVCGPYFYLYKYFLDMAAKSDLQR